MSCDNCTKGCVLPGEPVGSILPEFDGAYFTPGPEGSTKRAIVLLSDAFGLPLVNNKLIADHFAKSLSCDVWTPDLFAGEPFMDLKSMSPLLPDRAGAPFPLTSKLSLFGKLLPRIGRLYRNRPAVVVPRVISFISKLREEKKYEKIGAVGYCFGGSITIRIGSNPVVDSIVICHPGNESEETIKAIKAPAAWACAEDDMSFGPQPRQRAEEIFAARKEKENFVDYEFKDYKGTAHGFAARPNFEVPEVKEGYEQALQQTIDWFNRTIPA